MHLAGVICPRYVARGLLLLVGLAMTSCSDGKPSMNPVRGKVFYKDAPAAGVMISLSPVGSTDMKTQPSTGLTEEDGSFVITTGPDDGAPAGEYVVTAIWMQDASGKPKKPGVISMNSDTVTSDKLKGRYKDRNKSGLSNVTIKKGVNELEPFRLQ